MGSIFSITEIPQATGSKTRRQRIRFEWDNKHRNIPLQPWSFPTKLRTKRTDYPGTNSDPTEQVLGSHFEPFTLRGRWSDKFNEPGYAVKTWREFEALASSGNLVQFNFQDVFVVGLITDFVPTYLRRSEIEYSFTVSPHHRQPSSRLPRSPRTVLNATQLLRELEVINSRALELHARAPRFYIAGSLWDDVRDELEVWADTITAIDETISQRTIEPGLEPSSALLRIASMFDYLVTTARALTALLDSAETTTDLGFQQALNIILFDTWAKGINAAARLMVVTATRASRELKSRAEPNVIAIYRPQAGEHLHRISQRFYDTPFNWRRIASRNNLGNEFVLTGEELLIIPEALAR